MKYCYKIEDLVALPEQTDALRVSFSHDDLFTHLSRFAAHLRRLEIYNPAIQGIPEQIGTFRQLQSLTLLHMPQIQFLPAAIGQLEQLTELRIQGENSIEQLPEEIGNLSNLQTLSITVFKMTRLPESLGKLTKLLHFDLAGFYGNYYYKGKIADTPIVIPDTLANLSQLKTISWTALGLRALPDIFDNMQRLERLYIAQNPLYTLPSSLGKLQKLREIRLDNCYFPEFPATLLSCKNLENLSMAYCKLAKLPEQINQLQALHTLNIPSNALESLPETITQLPHLIHLSANRNQLKTVPDLSGLLSLRYLDIDYNQIETLPACFNQMDFLQRIQFEHNPFATPPLFFLYWQHFNNNKNIFSTLFIDKKRTNFYPRKFLNHLQDFLNFLVDKKIPAQHRLDLYNLLCKEKDAMAIMPLESVLYAFKSSIPTLLEHAQKWIENAFAKRWKQTPLQQNSTVAILGAFASGAEILLGQLQAVGLHVSTAITAKTTHVFLGNSLKESQIKTLCELTDRLLGTPAQLKAFLEKNEQLYLIEKPSPEAPPSTSGQSVSALLASSDLPTIEVALEMMSSGGAPKDTWTALYWARCYAAYNGARQQGTAKNIAQRCFQMLELYAHKRLAIMPLVYPSNSVTKATWDRIWKAVQGDLLDWAVLEPLFLQHKVRYVHHYWSELTPPAQDLAFQKHLEHNNFSLNLVDVSGAWDLLLRNAHLIKRFTMPYAKFGELPEPVLHLTNLEELDIQGNKIKELPDSLAKLQHLQHINITNNHLTKFPDVFNRMPNLRLISCSRNAFVTRLNNAVRDGKKPNIDTNIFDLSNLPNSISRK